MSHFFCQNTTFLCRVFQTITYTNNTVTVQSFNVRVFKSVINNLYTILVGF